MTLDVYPGRWRHPIPLHPTFVQPRPMSTLEPDRGRKLTLLYTDAESQDWVVTDRHLADLAFKAGVVLKQGTLEPDLDRVQVMYTDDLYRAKTLSIGRRHSLSGEDTLASRLGSRHRMAE